MSAITTRAPSRASRSAVARPMPEPAPVTIAVRPLKPAWGERRLGDAPGVGLGGELTGAGHGRRLPDTGGMEATPPITAPPAEPRQSGLLRS